MHVCLGVAPKLGAGRLPSKRGWRGSLACFIRSPRVTYSVSLVFCLDDPDLIVFFDRLSFLLSLLSIRSCPNVSFLTDVTDEGLNDSSLYACHSETRT
jgi:hypothetical protein